MASNDASFAMIASAYDLIKGVPRCRGCGCLVRRHDVEIGRGGIMKWMCPTCGAESPQRRVEKHDHDRMERSGWLFVGDEEVPDA